MLHYAYVEIAYDIAIGIVSLVYIVRSQLITFRKVQAFQ